MTGEFERSPRTLRERIRSGSFTGPTSGQAPGYFQGNLAILPEALAGDFLRFCVLNPKPCPLLAVGEAGDPRLPTLGADVDIRTDVPRYRIFRDGELIGSPGDLTKEWRDDLVTFVIGCSFSFEAALQRAGIRVPHIDADTNVPMYVTNIATKPAGPFAGPMVVSMRAFSPQDAIRAIVLSDRQPLAHGAPLHFGDPAAIGIADIMKPDFGDAPVIGANAIPVFWACGVTPQMAIRAARPDIAITHDPGHMLVTDLLAERSS
ncbi:MAG TPA: putative hydro-lyase [Aurantimonas coralicida]|uniref:Hydro-lyase n=2 Tax=root TaxID=1 RepID=A0A0F9TEN4_9ZZZZ|nr:putative hydro-lyase [Aurantimonas coralicida]HEU00660.1 putative hydro-lyase [Aurantimonas coralicida]